MGLHKPEAKLPFTPCIEIGRRLSKKYWGYGFATEGAHAALKYAFEGLFLEEVVSFTFLNNTRSKAVMQRLNMVDTNQNFEHPNIPFGHQLREHVLYKITKEQWGKMPYNKALGDKRNEPVGFRSLANSNIQATKLI